MQDGIKAITGSTNFSNLFLGFSFFLICSACLLIGLLFRLGTERRSPEVGILLAEHLRQLRLCLHGAELLVCHRDRFVGGIVDDGERQCGVVTRFRQERHDARARLLVCGPGHCNDAV